jgi:hypothetical protein
MEQPSNNVSSIFHIVIDLISGKTCKSTENNLSFWDFIQILSEESEYSVSWRVKNFGDKYLYLFTTDWQIRNILPDSNESEQHFINKYFNNLVIEVISTNNHSDSEYKVVMFSGSKVYDSNRDKTSLETIKTFIGDYNESELVIYDAIEGTSVNVFYNNNQWFFSTKRKFDMFESKFGNQRIHGEMVKDIVGDFETFTNKFNPSYTYHFVIVHSDNSHINDITHNKLVLTSVRNVSNFKPDFDEYNRILSTEYFHKPNPTNIKDFESLDIKNVSNTVQGIIIQYKDFIFRIYNKTYSNSLKQNPNFNSKHEKCFFDYQKNEFSKKKLGEKDSDIKTYTIVAFNFVAICLFRTLIHFTKFADKFSNEERQLKYKFIKQNIDDWDIYIIDSDSNNNALIRNINKLQRLPYAINNINTVDFNQVKFHLKYHCTPQDINAMFNSFFNNLNDHEDVNSSNPMLCDKIGYKLLTNIRSHIHSFKNYK